MIEDKEQALIPSPPVVKSENEIEEEDESFAKSLFNPSCAERMKQKYFGWFGKTKVIFWNLTSVNSLQILAQSHWLKELY